MKNIVCTKDIDSGDKLLRQPLLSYPVQSIYCFTASTFFSPSCSHQLPEILPVGGEFIIIYTAFVKIKSYPELLQTALLLCYLREICYSEEVAVLEGKEGR